MCWQYDATFWIDLWRLLVGLVRSQDSRVHWGGVLIGLLFMAGEGVIEPGQELCTYYACIDRFVDVII